MVKQRHPEIKDDKDIKTLCEKDRALTMLVIHNTKVDKIINRYKEEQAKKQRAQDLGISVKELEEKEAVDEKPSIS